MTPFMVGNLTLNYITRIKSASQPTLGDSRTLARIAERAYEEQGCMIDYSEYIFVILASRNGKVLGAVKVGEGCSNGCTADIKKIMAAACLSGASNIALVHNHPQSAARPSTADRELTREVAQACKIFGVRLIDHVILADYDTDGTHKYYSFRDNGEI